jgi:hypothetical protein
MENGPLAELTADIKENGLQEEIWTYQGKILEGRNRYAACRLAHVEPEFQDYLGEDPLGFVISKNLKRRNLTVAQRAEIALKIATMRKGTRTDLTGRGVSQAEAAETVGVSRRSVQRAAAKTKPTPAKKKEPKDPSSWTADELKEDKALLAAFTAIAAVYGNEDTKAIRTGLIGLKKKDVIFLSKLPKEKMQECQDLIMANHWTPQESVKFLNKMPDDKTTVDELKSFCLSTKGKFYEATIGGFTITCKANRASPRKH